jgi:plastocyanin
LSPGRRVAVDVGVAFLVVACILGVAVVPALAHDDDVSGPADVTITIGSGLSDRDVRVSGGDVIRFVNRDDERHRMRARSGPDEFDTGNLEPGESFQLRLSAAGTYAYLDERDRDAAAYRGRIVVGSGGTSGVTPPPGGAAGGGASGVAGATATTATVTIGDDFYQPTSVRIAAGGTVTFRNTGGDEHSATSSEFDTGVLAGGASARKTFESPGTFDFLCIFHSDMRGTIEVVAADGGTAAPPEAPRPTPSPTPTPLPAPTADPTPSLVDAPAEVAVDAADFEFRPTTIDVAAGGRVTWTNAGVAPHTVTASAGMFDSGMLDAGATFAQTFDTPGSYDYVCAVHPEMTATVRVVPATAAAGSDGGAPAAPVRAGPDSSAPAPDPAPTGDAAPTAGVPNADSDPTAGTTRASDVSGLAGIVVTVTLVSTAVALFSRAVRGTVRVPERGADEAA